MSREVTRNTRPHISLKPFQEVVGQLETIRETDGFTIIELSAGSLQFPASSDEADLCEQELQGHEGARIAILRTPSIASPIRILVADDDELH